MIGVAKADSVVDISLLEYCIREDLKAKVPRIMTVIDPVKVVLTNYDENKIEYVDIENNPEDPSMGFQKGAIRQEFIYRSRRFHGNSDQEILQNVSWKEVRLKEPIS